MKNLGLFLILLISTLCYGQDMKAGFGFLETGKYTEAQTFFKEVLNDYPTNKTARLCYGRALGLNGHTTAAKELFTDLKATYPTDFEILLNYAESLLWNKDFNEAKCMYKDLVKKDSTSFPATLGYANTLSNLKEYNAALLYVNKALDILPGNQNAVVSKKYMRLGKASQSLTAQDYPTSISLLEENLVDFPNDTDSMGALANVYITTSNFEKANHIYNKIEDRSNALVGLSLVAHLDSKNKKALQFAKEATTLANTDSLKIMTTQERYIQALIWNGKYKNAALAIDSLTNLLGSSNRINALSASMSMYTGKINKGIAYYRTILEKDSTSFSGNLGIANAYRGQGNLKKAYAYAQKTLEYYPEQKDAKSLIAAIDNSLSPTVNTNVAYTRDNGDNEAYGASINATVPFSDRFTASFNYSYRTTENMTLGNMANNTNISLGTKYRIKNNTWVESTLGFTEANADVNSYTDVNGSLFLKTRPFALQNLEIGYSRTLQNFNAALIDEKIFLNNYMLNYNMGTTFNLGWYTGLTHTQQTDGNSRNLLFTSLYYTFTKAPAIKAGLNYQYLSYKQQIPNQYFSPSIYQAAEAFIDLNGNSGKWTYLANVAGGYQFVEQDEATTLLRAEVKLIYSFSPRLQAGAYGKYSNIASATATGFEFTEVGCTIRLQVTKGKLFKF
ncbi:tetratricopeptide repeat protein [uncultured Nonlabens sp.]|uniref:tetratricopeptide repeat protein n=1 Tax=uncultured Nonlabens sp. TaxID=859306 RepID=UPI002638725F|nr:tetratricopeptide repeat protein [uncultured Nonlabens sp.]